MAIRLLCGRFCHIFLPLTSLRYGWLLAVCLLTLLKGIILWLLLWKEYLEFSN